MLKTSSAYNWKIKPVAEYSVELVDSTLIKRQTRVLTDLTLITPVGQAKLEQVLFNVVPGPAAPILIGQVELRRMGIPTLWSLIEDAIRK